MVKKQIHPIIRLFLLLISIFVIFSGCSTDDNNANSTKALIQTNNPPPSTINGNEKDQKLVMDVKKKVMSKKEVYDVSVIKGEQDILVAYKVRHLKRFRMKKIEADLQKELEKEFPDEKFTISSDYKIFLESIRLQDKINNKQIPKEDLEKRLSEIIKLSNEKT